jgi:hypothetical protein
MDIKKLREGDTVYFASSSIAAVSRVNWTVEKEWDGNKIVLTTKVNSTDKKLSVTMEMAKGDGLRKR